MLQGIVQENGHKLDEASFAANYLTQSLPRFGLPKKLELVDVRQIH